MENFSDLRSVKKHKKSNFHNKKDCLLQSLKEVNVFLCSANSVKKAIYLFKFFR